jgi:hypothetical protein
MQLMHRGLEERRGERMGEGRSRGKQGSS